MTTVLRVMGTVAIKALEFVDDIADLNSGSENAANSNKIIVSIQERKRLTFAAEKCRILKIYSFDFSIFIPRLIYNCETWTNITSKDYASLRKSQLSFLRRALELPRSVPTAALYLELGIWPIKCEIAIRQLLFL